MARLPRGEALASRLRGRRRAARAHARGVGGRGQRERSRRRARRHPRWSDPHDRAVAGGHPGAPPQPRRALAPGRHAHGPLARGASRAPRARRVDGPARPVGTGPRQTDRRDEVNCKVPPQEPRVPDQSDGGIRERRAHPELAAEQRYLDRAYGRRDERRKAASRVAEGYSEVQGGGTHQARLERDAAAANTRRRLAALNIGNAPLSFGRIDLEPSSDGEGSDDDRFYIGRISVTEADQTPLIVDWRAPVAEPFYRATGVEPMGVVRRRHFQTQGRELIGIDDEVFDAAAADEAGFTIVGEAALLAALERHRTGRMGDIVATIQAEQDEAVRAPLSGIIAVAGLKPRWRARASEPPAIAARRGDARMAGVIARALRARERPPRDALVVVLDGHVLRLRRADSARIVERVRRRRGPHNERRPAVTRMVLDQLRDQYRRSLVAAYERDVRRIDPGAPLPVAPEADDELLDVPVAAGPPPGGGPPPDRGAPPSGPLPAPPEGAAPLARQ